MKNSLFFIRIFIISICLISSVSFINSQKIEFDFPEEVKINEEVIFKIKLIDFIDDVYDLKIDLLNNGTRVAQILNNGEWKSTFYYLNDAIKNSEEKVFLIKIIKPFENAIIEVKIKNSEGIVNTFTGYNLTLKEGISESESDSIIYKEPEITSKEEIVEEENIQEKYESVQSENEKSISNISQENKEIIYFNTEPLSLINNKTKSIKTEENKETLQKTLSLLGIITIILFITALILLKELKNRKNELN